MDDETRVELLNFWINSGEPNGKIPEALKSKVSDDDVTQLENEIELADPEQFKLSDILKYRNETEERIERKRRAAMEEKLIKLQEKTNWSQWIIVAVMIFTSVLAFYDTTIASQSYNINFEESRPNLHLFLDCSYRSVGGILNITTKVENSGKSGSYVSLKIYTPDGDLENPTIEGVPFTPSNKSVIERGAFFVKSDDLIIQNFISDIRNLDVPRYRVYVQAVCLTQNCKFNTLSEYSCSYVKKGDYYERSPDSLCAK